MCDSKTCLTNILTLKLVYSEFFSWKLLVYPKLEKICYMRISRPILYPGLVYRGKHWNIPVVARSQRHDSRLAKAHRTSAFLGADLAEKFQFFVPGKNDQKILRFFPHCKPNLGKITRSSSVKCARSLNVWNWAGGGNTKGRSPKLNRHCWKDMKLAAAKNPPPQHLPAFSNTSLCGFSSGLPFR